MFKCYYCILILMRIYNVLYHHKLLRIDSKKDLNNIYKKDFNTLPQSDLIHELISQLVLNTPVIL